MSHFYDVRLNAVKIGAVSGATRRECQIRAELLAWQNIANIFKHVIEDDLGDVLVTVVNKRLNKSFGTVHIVATVGYKTIFCRVERAPE